MPPAAKAALLGLLTLAAGGGASAQPGAGLSSPMVDRSIYREGAVRRSTHRFGQWTLTCDEIKGLGRRFCSLRSAALGQLFADVSTGDDGRPSVLLHLPLAVSLRFGVKAQVAAAPPLRGMKTLRAAAPPPGRNATIATCNARECLAVWTLAAAEIRALSSGQGLTVTYCVARPGRLEFSPDLATSGCAARVAQWLPGNGFGAAVEASLQ